MSLNPSFEIRLNHINKFEIPIRPEGDTTSLLTRLPESLSRKIKHIFSPPPVTVPGTLNYLNGSSTQTVVDGIKAQEEQSKHYEARY